MSVLLTSIITSGLLIFVIKPLSWGVFDYLPAGPTPLVFSILAQYHSMVPQTYRYRLATSPVGEEFSGLTLSDKSYRYALALQLALFQSPGSLLGALVGWVVGYSWRNDLLPGRITQWRMPGWMLGLRDQKLGGTSDEFEGLRRRLEGEGADPPTASASGAQSGTDTDGARRRGGTQQLFDQFRGTM